MIDMRDDAKIPYEVLGGHVFNVIEAHRSVPFAKRKGTRGSEATSQGMPRRTQARHSGESRNPEGQRVVRAPRDIA